MVTLPCLPALVIGSVTHTRLTPWQRRFRYRQYQWLIDVDHPPRLPGPLRGLARFDAGDHLSGNGFREDLGRSLVAHGHHLDPADRVIMLTHARAWWHVFDPLTIYWVFTTSDTLRAMVLEVHNTYGGRHVYVFDDLSGVADKAFYVSPFNDVSGHYRVTARLTQRRVSAAVTLLDDAREPVLIATTTGRPVPVTTWRVMGTALLQPLMTWQVSLLIRWQGIRLWSRRLPVHPRPAATGGAR